MPGSPPDDQRLKSKALVPGTGRILEGPKWDGSDIINCGWYFITKRALEVLLSVHAAPFYARPARVDVEGLSKQQLGKAETAKHPLPMKK